MYTWPATHPRHILPRAAFHGERANFVCWLYEWVGRSWCGGEGLGELGAGGYWWGWNERHLWRDYDRP